MAEIIEVSNVVSTFTDDPFVRITFDGIGVMVFTDIATFRGAKIGSFRHGHSPLRFVVYKADGNVHWTSDSLATTVGVDFTVNSRNPGDLGSRYEAGTGDDRSFSHIPNLSGADFHARDVTTKPRILHHFSSVVSVHGGMFYNAQMSINDAIALKLDRGTIVDVKNIGRVGRLLAAGIASNENSIYFTYGLNGQNHEVAMPRADGPYEIHVCNCSLQPQVSHFSHLYDVIAVNRGECLCEMIFTGDEGASICCTAQSSPPAIMVGKVACQKFYAGFNDLT